MIESLDLTRQDFFSDGKAQRIEFTIQLIRIDDTLLDVIGSVTRGILEQIG